MNLGRRIDDLVTNGAYVLEREHHVNVSNLTASSARELSGLCGLSQLSFSIHDEAGTAWQDDDLDEAFAPFRILITKSTGDGSVLQVLTERGFRDLLVEPNITHRCWWIAGLGASIRTWERSYMPWGKAAPALDDILLKNPRYLVREYSAERTVPSDVGRWILRDLRDLGVADPLRTVWAEAATAALLSTLPNEIDADTGSLRFRGPPKLTLVKPTDDEVTTFAAGLGFNDLQKAASWVFESEREAETRHLLLASEIARSSAVTTSATSFLLEELKTALDGARVAYEMHLSSVGADTLKSLAELRKAVTEETGKVTEATRQTSAAVASALAVGLGLLAAKATTAVSSLLVTGLMLVAVAYVTMVIVTGWIFVVLHRKARVKWQERLYRFIPKGDFDELVTVPTSRSELAFVIASLLGRGSVVVLAIIVVFFIPPEAPISILGP